MCDKTLKVSLRHPLHDRVLALELPASLTFGELLKLLYKNGFIQPKPADYGFIINGRFCALNMALQSYVPPEADAVDIDINGMLTIMT